MFALYFAHTCLNSLFIRTGLYKEYDVTKKDTPMSFLVSYYVINIISQIYFFGTGIYLLTTLDKSMMDPCYICPDPDIETYLLRPMLAYQAWTTITSWQSADLNHGSAMFHHVVSWTLAFTILKSRLFYSQSILYAGLFELSSVFLNVNNLSKVLLQGKNEEGKEGKEEEKEEKEKEKKKGKKWIKLCFAASFILIRNVMLPIVSYGPVMYLIEDRNYTNYCILLCLTLLIGFQYYWGYKIGCIIYSS